jgi:hypothetical protein
MTTDTVLGSSAIAAVLESIAVELVGELTALRRLFDEQVAPRAHHIGQLLARARSQFPQSAAFYDWAQSTVGIRERQVRSYLRFFERYDAILRAAEEQEAQISSIEQGLALLAPARIEPERDENELRLAAVAQATSRAKGSIGRALEAICELHPGGLTPADQAVLQAAYDLLDRWGKAGAIPPTKVVITPAEPPELPSAGAALAAIAERAIEAHSDPEPPATLAVTAEEFEEWLADPTATLPKVSAKAKAAPDPQLVGRGEAAGLPMGLAPSKWTLAQLEEGSALYGNNSALGRALGCSSNAIGQQLKRKRAEAGLDPDS